VVAPLGLIQGRSEGLNTSGRPVACVQQIREWIQVMGFQTMVTSPFVYFFVISDIRKTFDAGLVWQFMNRAKAKVFYAEQALKNST
jgi:hypothetical protein